MFDISLNEEYLIKSENSSIGIQEKYYKDGYWYKLDNYGGEANAEMLASLVLQNSTLLENEYATYESGMVNNKTACRSKNFLKENEELLTFNMVHETIIGCSFGKPMLGKKYQAKIEYCMNFFEKYFNLDISSYLAKTLYLDMVIRNEDRNFGNLAVIYNSESNKYTVAPIFDNGFSLLVGNEPYKHNGSIKDRIKNVTGKPFVSNLEIQANCFSVPFNINYKKLYNQLFLIEPSLQKDALMFQLEKYQNVFSCDKSISGKIEELEL